MSSSNGSAMIRRGLLLASIAIPLAALAPSGADAAARFLVACTTSCTWDNSSTLIWSTTSGGAAGSAAPTSADDVTLDANSCVGGVTCTITTNATISIKSLTTGTCTASTTGCVLDFSANNNSITVGGSGIGWNNSGTGTRAMKLGSGTFTLTDTNGNLWNWATTTNLTLTAGTSTILFSAVSLGNRQFLGGTAQTYYNFTVSNASANTGLITFNGATSLIFSNNVTLTNVRNACITSNITTTISGALSYSGASNQYGILNTCGGAAASIAATISLANTTTLQNLLIQNIIATGAGSFACNPCVDGGGNTSVTITAPSGGGSHCIGC